VARSQQLNKSKTQRHAAAKLSSVQRATAHVAAAARSSSTDARALAFERHLIAHVAAAGRRAELGEVALLRGHALGVHLRAGLPRGACDEGV